MAKGGIYYWVDTTIVPFTDKNGIPEKYIYSLNDVKVTHLKYLFSLEKRVFLSGKCIEAKS